ncbi:MAG: hypothetical protein KDA60_11995 [Planctomycetales bacterium]|nr:hypothetical protein [Planctomycetales bacterium]
MKPSGWLLIEGADAWHLVPLSRGNHEAVDLESVEVPAELAERAAEAAHHLGGVPGPVVIALASRSCLAATFPHAGRSEIRTREAKAFKLEEMLPLSAEDTVSDFMVFDQSVFGVAVETRVQESILRELENVGFRIASVSPRALLELQTVIRSKDKYANEPFVVLRSDATTDVFQLHDGKPCRWRCVPSNKDAISRELLQLGATQETAVLWHGSNAEDASVALTQADVRQLPEDRTPLIVDHRFVVELLAGKSQPWIELYRDGLGNRDALRPIRRYLRMVTAASIMLAVCLAVALYLRAERFTDQTERLQAQMDTLFRETFPGQSVPVGKRARFESEYRKLAGVTGQVADVPQLDCALTQLQVTLGHLPTELRYRVNEIRIAETTIFLEGELRQHGDADKVASALRKAGFEVEPPRMEALEDQGVSFGLTAAPSNDGAGVTIAERSP